MSGLHIGASLDARTIQAEAAYRLSIGAIWEFLASSNYSLCLNFQDGTKCLRTPAYSRYGYLTLQRVWDSGGLVVRLGRGGQGMC